MKVAIIIVTWNNEKDIEACLSSVLNQSYKSIKVIVIDNNSADQTTSIVETKFPQVILIKEKINHFLTGGNNIGISYAMQELDPEYIMVLNPDTKSDSKLVEKLVKVLEDDGRIGAAGPKVKFWNNKNEGLINSAGLVFDGFMQAYDIGFMQKDDGGFDKPAEVFGVTGACVLYRTKMLQQIGLYWDRIKMYLDEVEMFIRVNKNGWKVMYVPDAILHHSYMRSTNQNKLFSREKQIRKAWLLIALRHYGLKSKIAMLIKYARFVLMGK